MIEAPFIDQHTICITALSKKRMVPIHFLDQDQRNHLSRTTQENQDPIVNPRVAQSTREPIKTLHLQMIRFFTKMPRNLVFQFHRDSLTILPHQIQIHKLHSRIYYPREGLSKLSKIIINRIELTSIFTARSHL